MAQPSARAAGVSYEDLCLQLLEQADLDNRGSHPMAANPAQGTAP